MALVEAVLTYRPHGLDPENAASVPIGKTDDPIILRALRNCLLEAVGKDCRLWEGIDPGVAAMRRGELERLVHIFSVLLPEEETRPDFHLVAQDHDEKA
jgi:hypothetical protein